jgi:glycosyltransferase involved in cell wall biosynthesis
MWTANRIHRIGGEGNSYAVRVALVHPWFVHRGGGERVAECMAALVPDAKVFTLVSQANALPASLPQQKVSQSMLRFIPGARRLASYLFPLYPLATRSLNLNHFDVVLSSDYALVKSVRKKHRAVHLCYCHSPMRALYDGFDSYQYSVNPVMRRIFRAVAPHIRRFDRAGAAKVDDFTTNSYYVAERIQRLYGRESTVIYPPIDMSRARLNTPGDHYLCAGRLVDYKRTQMMILVCERLGRKLRIAGTGPEMKKLRALAGPNTTFLGELSDEELWNEYSRCRALLFAADEDFGMIPLEVQACGRPVIAFGFGGSLETVRSDNPPTRYAPHDAESDELARTQPTGMYFSPQTAQALLQALLRFEQQESRFDPVVAQAFAARFDTPVFLSKLREHLIAEVPSLEPQLATVATAMETLTQRSHQTVA